MNVARRWGIALAALAIAAAGATAQAKKDAKAPVNTCSLPDDKPDELAAAKTALNKVILLNQADQQKKALATAVEKLTLRPDHYHDNQATHEYLLGQALIQWSKMPDVGPNPKRGTIGYLGDKEQPIDLLKTADSLFADVEKSNPQCAEETSAYRQMAWSPLINQVGPLLNAGNADSATALLKRANVIYQDSPYGPYFEGQIAYKKEQDQQASLAYEKAAKLGAPAVMKDPSDQNLAFVTEFSAFFAPYTGGRAAAKMTGADQTAAYKRAIGLYQDYLKNYSCAQFAENAYSGIFEALRATDDTAGVRTQLTAMSNDAKPCTDMQLYNASRDAKDINQTALAVTLADKAVAFSPWSAGLGNAAGVYLAAEEWTKLEPVAKRLTQIAPNSPDNFQILALTYLGFSKKGSAAAKKSFGDSAATAYEDGEKLDVNVHISQFTSDGTKRTIAGTAVLVDHTPGAQPATKPKTGKGAKPAAATSSTAPKARAVTIKVDFLDRAGAVVSSDSATVTASAGEPTSFKLTADNAKIIGYKYAPVH